DRQVKLLAAFMRVARKGLELIDAGTPAATLIAKPLFTSLQRMKGDRDLKGIDTIEQELAS
ncbi:MAG TPA: hypothetical protein VLU46_01300, partial [Thermoanaerobaculia bacterium]|nr:hypothetical protein [Thermoanaerobaculia bacterium]